MSVLEVVAVALLLAQSAPAPASDNWKPLRFLMGAWEAKTKGGSAAAVGSGTYSFQLELRDHVLSRRSVNAGCKGPADYDCEHTDLLYVYHEGPGRSYQAIYFDNEGHVIHYEISFPGTSRVVFLSSSSQPGPQFRLSYELKGVTMYGKFQMRAPGQTEFTSYLEWSGVRK
jgi:hypothetical protein